MRVTLVGGPLGGTAREVGIHENQKLICCAVEPPVVKTNFLEVREAYNYILDRDRDGNATGRAYYQLVIG